MTKIITLISIFLFASLYTLGCTGVVGFTFPSGTFCSGQSIVFTNNSNGCANTYTWVWGDASANTVVNSTASQTHLYSSGGSFNVCLIRHCIADSCTDTVCNIITILLSPDATLIDANTNFNNCVNVNSTDSTFTLTVTNATTTTATNATYKITWGDGSPQVVLNNTFTDTSHTYLHIGIFNLVFTVIGTDGCVSTTTYTVLNISNPAIGLASLGGTQGCGPKTICFPITNADSNYFTTIYHFNPGDGSPIQVYPHPPPDTICYTYNTTSCPGQFTASMTAINPCDSTTATVDNIKIFTGPKASFTVNPDSIGCINTPFTFTNTSITGYNSSCQATTTYKWNFGDVSAIVTLLTNATQTHSYTTSGIFTVTLIASNSCGPDTFILHVCVN